MRLIFHVDMDAFYASIEQRDAPELRGRPVIVGGRQRRGVVAAASYEVRRFGVHSAMPMARAMRLCPHAVVLAPRIGYYSQVSQQIRAVFDRYSPLVEPLSLDEAFLDMTGTERLFGEPMEVARAIKADIVEATGGLTCSIGIAPNKFLAKIASELDKPDGISFIRHGTERERLAPMAVRRIWGVGAKTAERLGRLGLRTVGDVAQADPAALRRQLGQRHADHLMRLARGEDDRPVVVDREQKSVGGEVTLPEDLTSRAEVEHHLRHQCERVARDLRKKGLLARSVRVKVRYTAGFDLHTRQGPLPYACDDSRTLFEAGCRLLDALDCTEPIRLVGAAAFDLVGDEDTVQLDMFAAATAQERSSLEQTMDAIRDKFGDKIMRGSQE